MIGRIVACVVLMGMAAQAFAGGSVVGKVIDVRVDKNGQGMVTFDQQVTGGPQGCVTPSYTNALAFNTETAGGRSILALALAAKATGDTVYAFGTGACAIYGGVLEDLNYAQIH